MQLDGCCCCCCWPRARLKGLVQLKKNPRGRRKRGGDQLQPPVSRALFFLLNLAALFLELAHSSSLTSDGLQLSTDNQIDQAPSSSKAGQDEQMSSIKLSRFQVPNQVKAGELRRLICQYEMQGATLHAVKLFKDNKEFYRYLSSDQKLVFPVPGIQLDLSRSNAKDVWLRINRRSTGVYRCQVSVENTFNSVSAERRMEVIDASSPNQPPDQMGSSSSSAWPYSGPNARPKSSVIRAGGGPPPASSSRLLPKPAHLPGSTFNNNNNASRRLLADNNHHSLTIIIIITSALMAHLLLALESGQV